MMTNFDLINKENTVTLKSGNIVNNQSRTFVFASHKQEIIAKRIEHIASKLYACKWMSEFQKNVYVDRLAALLLSYLGLGDFTFYRYEDGQSLESKKNANKYSGIVFTRCFNDTLKKYGIIDRKTNKRIPFLQLFSYYYSKRKSDIIVEHALDENHTNVKAKREKQRELFKRAKAEVGYTGRVPRIDYSNRIALLSILRLIGAPEYYMVQAEENHNAYYEQKDYDCDVNEKSDRSVNDSYAIVQNADKENTMCHIIYLIDKVKKKAVVKEDRNVSKHLRNFVTLNAREYMNSNDSNNAVMLNEYLNKDLLNYAEGGTSSDIQIYAEFANMKPDSVRKLFKHIQKFVVTCAAEEEIAA